MNNIQQLLQEWAITSTILEDATEAAMAPLRPMQETVKNLESQIRKHIEAIAEAESADAKAWIAERRSISYDPGSIRALIPEYAPMIIEEIVSKKKIESLIKAKLVTEEQIKPAEIVEVSKAFYLRRKKAK